MGLLAVIDLEILLCDDPSYENTDFIERILKLSECDDFVSDQEDAFWLFSETLMDSIWNKYPWNSPVGDNVDVMNTVSWFLGKHDIRKIVVQDYKSLAVTPPFYDYVARLHPELEREWNNILYFSQSNLHTETIIFSYSPKPDELSLIYNQETYIFSILKEKDSWPFFQFYCPNDVWNDIQIQTDIQRILSNKFHNKQHRDSKTEHKIHGKKGTAKYAEHFVFDDGDNNNRIYYFYNEKDDIYIYKTFENEPEAKAYIKEQIDRDEIKKSSRPHNVKKIT